MFVMPGTGLADGVPESVLDSPAPMDGPTAGIVLALQRYISSFLILG